MVFVNCPKKHRLPLENFLFDRKILVASLDRGRLVCHLGVSEKDIKFVVNVFEDYFRKQ